jgi:hypothetical protein
MKYRIAVVKNGLGEIHYVAQYKRGFFFFWDILGYLISEDGQIKYNPNLVPKYYHCDSEEKAQNLIEQHKIYILKKSNKVTFIPYNKKPIEKSPKQDVEQDEELTNDDAKQTADKKEKTPKNCNQYIDVEEVVFKGFVGSLASILAFGNSRDKRVMTEAISASWVIAVLSSIKEKKSK